MNTTGTSNTYVGANANSVVAMTGLTNATAIGANTTVGQSNALILGNNVNVGVGTSTPNASALLELVATNRGVLVPRVALTQTTSNAPVTAPATSLLVYNTATINDVTPGFYYWNGTAWVRFATGAASSNDWSLLGNAATVDGTNFIGTIDNIPFNIRVNNQKAGRIDHVSFNTFFGHLAGNSTTGISNTAVGSRSLFTNVTGTQNTAIGYRALELATVSDNVAIGHAALAVSTTGTRNTSIGSLSLTANTTGLDNVAVGHQAFFSNTTGNSGVAVGQNALRNNTTGASNVAVGQGALFTNSTGNYNNAIGQNALNLTTTGSNNIAVGRFSLSTNSTGNQNIGIGNSTLTSNTTASANIAIGHSSLSTNTTGTRNVGIGTTALNLNASGNDNIAIGNNALSANIAGANNIGIGSGALLLNTSGNNVALGTSAGDALTTGANNTMIGSNTDGIAGLSNATAIGANAVVSASNAMVLGNNANVGIGTSNPVYAKLQVVGYSVFTATNAAFGATTRAAYIRGNDTYSTATTPDYTWYNSDQTGMFHPAASTIAFCANGPGETMRINAVGNVGIGCTAPAYKLHVIGDIASSATVRSTAAVVTGAIAACSDGRYKKDVENLTGSLDKIMQLRPVTYNWKTEEFPEKNFTSNLQIGFIAQELEKVIPQVVHTDSVDNNYKSVDYGRLTPVLVEAMKEQQMTIETLKAENKAMKLELETMKQMQKDIDALKAELQTITTNR